MNKLINIDGKNYILSNNICSVRIVYYEPQDFTNYLKTNCKYDKYQIEFQMNNGQKFLFGKFDSLEECKNMIEKTLFE